MLSIEQLRDLGVLITQEQLDFLHHPVGRLAIAVFGVPDPDRLYIAGPENGGDTLHQVAPEGTIHDARGLQPIVFPIVVECGYQDELARIVADNIGDIADGLLPVLYGTSCDNSDSSHFIFIDDTVPLWFSPWDFWPIDLDEKPIWEAAVNGAIDGSRLYEYFNLHDVWTNGTEHELVDEELDEEYYDLRQQGRALVDNGASPDDPRVQQINRRIEEIAVAQEETAHRQVSAWEDAITHPVSGEYDAQVPPLDLPYEQATIWSSLQSLTWRNWRVLQKNFPEGDDCLGGRRFADVTRRLCPWF